MSERPSLATRPRRTREPARACVAIGTAAALALCGQAASAPALPQSPAPDALVETVRPTFTWTPGTSGVPVARYEVFMETGGDPLKLAEAPAGTLSATAAIDLPDDGGHRWFVRLTNVQGGVANTPPSERRTVQVATTPAAPTIVDGVSGLTGTPTPLFSWTGDRVDSRWALLDATGVPLRSGESPFPGGRLAMAPLTDGAYVFRVVQRNLVGVEGAPATRAFTVDTTPPPAPVPSASPPGRDHATTPAFSWSGVEAGGRFAWRVRGPAGAVLEGPSETTLTVATPRPLPPGAYEFEVRGVDAAGNVGAWGSEPFSLTPVASRPGAATSAAAATINLLRRNAAALRPGAGARVAHGRPTLRWRRGPAGTTLYNLQIFLSGPGGRLTKVGSAFPRRTLYSLPRGEALTPGHCYVWRVWPFRGGRYSASPLGVSDFCVRD